MRNAISLLLLIAAIFIIQSTHAVTRMCGLVASKETNGLTSVTCSSCTSREHYALAGAAAAKSSGLNQIAVVSPNGNTRFHVTLSPAYKNASGTVGGGVGVTATITHGIVDPNSTTVTAYATWGSATGSAFPPQSVPNTTIADRCAMLVKNEEQKWEEQQQKLKDAKDPSTFYGDLIGQHNPAAYTGGWIGTYANRGRKTRVCTDGQCTVSY